MRQRYIVLSCVICSAIFFALGNWFAQASSDPFVFLHPVVTQSTNLGFLLVVAGTTVWICLQSSKIWLRLSAIGLGTCALFLTLTQFAGQSSRMSSVATNEGELTWFVRKQPLRHILAKAKTKRLFWQHYVPLGETSYRNIDKEFIRPAPTTGGRLPFLALLKHGSYIVALSEQTVGFIFDLTNLRFFSAQEIYALPQWLLIVSKQEQIHRAYRKDRQRFLADLSITQNCSLSSQLDQISWLDEEWDTAISLAKKKCP